MSIRWRVDPADLLKQKGYTSYRIRREKIFGQQSYRNLCQGKDVSFGALGKICDITGLQPGDLIENVPDSDSESQSD